ncbi:MAG TPA: hypothetical protein DCZ05_12400 [Deltaproteobacteria bacterium]|nr:hypothetical protein [Deltaproteobacteria bacterium]
MDFETAAECYYEIKRAGHYKEEALELLWSECSSSNVLTEAEKIVLTQALDKIQRSGRLGDSASTEQIWTVLTQHGGFQREWARIVAERLLGKRK